MKKILTLIILFAFVLSPVNAQTPTETEKTTTQNTIPTDSVELEKIQKIKDIVASKVAELDLVEKRGIIGKIKERKNMVITIEDIKGNTRNIDVDELTKFDIGDDDEELGLSDLENDTLYSFIGLFNKDNERLLARTITEVNTIPVFFEGAVKSINDDDFQLEVINSSGETKTVDVQSSTKTSLSKVDSEIEKSGFSKIALNERVLIAGFLDTKDDTLIVATRIMHFESLPLSQQMKEQVGNVSQTSESVSE